MCVIGACGVTIDASYHLRISLEEEVALGAEEKLGSYIVCAHAAPTRQGPCVSPTTHKGSSGALRHWNVRDKALRTASIAPYLLSRLLLGLRSNGVHGPRRGLHPYIRGARVRRPPRGRRCLCGLVHRGPRCRENG